MGEHRDSLTDAGASRGALGVLFELWLGPDRNPAGVVYGTITVGGVLAAEGSRGETIPRTIISAALILLLYWLVHAWSDDTGKRVESRRAFSARLFATELRTNWAIVRGSVVPLIAVVVAAGLGASDSTALWVGTIAAAVGLAAIEALTAMRIGLAWRQVVLQTLVGAAFGATLIALRVVLHPTPH